jgi:predicted O-methyltransferase YrrM
MGAQSQARFYGILIWSLCGFSGLGIQLSINWIRLGHFHPLEDPPVIISSEPCLDGLDTMTAGDVSWIEPSEKAISKGDYGWALELLKKARDAGSTGRDLNYSLALCLTQTGKAGEAYPLVLEDLRLFPDQPRVRKLLSEIQAKLACDEKTGSVKEIEFQQLYNIIRPYTKMAEPRLHTLYQRAKQICGEDLPGNFIEWGVSGGSTALLAFVIKKYSRQPRKVFAFDGFGETPDESRLKDLCTKLGVLDVVTLVKGSWVDTLPANRDRLGMIGLLHVDGNGYEAIQAVLTHLYDRIVDQGCLQIDDFGLGEGCCQAVCEFQRQKELQFNFHMLDAGSVWVVKPDVFPLNPVYPASMVEDFTRVDPVKYQITSQMSINERFQLFYILSDLVPRKNKKTRFVEVGSFAGSSLFMIAHSLCAAGHDIEGFAVDPGNHPQLPEVLKHLSPKVSHYHLYSHQAVDALRRIFDKDGNFPNFIFVDGDHTYEGVKRDIQAYYPLLAPGGIMAFHDFLPALDKSNRGAIFEHHGGSEPGIRQACVEMMETTYHCQVLEIPLPYPTNPAQTQAYLPIIPGVYSTLRCYRKTGVSHSHD